MILLVFDLDQTLINTIDRQYSVTISSIIETVGPSLSISYEKYLELRNKGKTTKEILEYLKIPEVDIKYIMNHWIEQIENIENLKLDSLIIDRNLLGRLSADNYLLSLLSYRSNINNAYKQIIDSDLILYFDVIRFIKHGQSNDKKYYLAKWSNQFEQIIFFSDTFSDYQSTIELKIKFVHLKSGYYDSRFDGLEITSYNDINEAIREIDKILI